MTDRACRVCKKANCDDDCEELALIYRERQREIAQEIVEEPEDCSHD